MGILVKDIKNSRSPSGRESDHEQDEVDFEVVSVSWGIRTSNYLVASSRLSL